MRLATLLLTLVLNISACNPPQEVIPTPPPVAENPSVPNDPQPNNPPAEEPSKPTHATMQITVNNTTLTATILDNATAREFKSILPLTANMSELNGNEKYCYLPSNLPTSPSNPGTIQSGDIMLFGSNCLVLFYKTFSTPYSYTRISIVDNPSALHTALGSGNVVVEFKLTTDE